MVPQLDKKGKQYIVLNKFGIYFNETVTSIFFPKEKKTLETEMMFKMH